MENKVSNILIICPSMWPQMKSWGETQRMYYLANHLVQNQCCVFTVSPVHESSVSQIDAIQHYKSFFLGKQTNANGTNQVQYTDSAPRHLIAKLRRLGYKVFSPVIQWIYNEPDGVEGLRKQLWIKQYKSDILAIIHDYAIDKIIISAPTFMLFKLGEMIHKRFPQVVLIYDYRDPWHLWNKKKNLAYIREKKYLKYADYVIGFSDVFCADMIKAFKIPDHKISTIYNGYSERDWLLAKEKYKKGDQSQSTKLRITYTGNLVLLDDKANYRNLQLVIDTIAKHEDIELLLVGVNGPKAGTTEGNVHYIGKVSQQESFQYMLNTDVLISIHDSSDYSGQYIISGKFYDYIRSEKVIWHIGATRDLMSHMVKTYKLGLFCENNTLQISATLQQLLEHWKHSELLKLRCCSSEEMSFFSREVQNEKYAEVIKLI